MPTKSEIQVGLIRSYLESKHRGVLDRHPLSAEYKFHATRRWKFDLAIPSLMSAVEYEGGDHYRGKSRHSTGKGFVNDVEKYSVAAAAGWRVVRVTACQLKSGVCFTWIDQLLEGA